MAFPKSHPSPAPKLRSWTTYLEFSHASNTSQISFQVSSTRIRQTVSQVPTGNSPHGPRHNRTRAKGKKNVGPRTGSANIGATSSSKTRKSCMLNSLNKKLRGNKNMAGKTTQPDATNVKSLHRLWLSGRVNCSVCFFWFCFGVVLYQKGGTKKKTPGSHLAIFPLARSDGRMPAPSAVRGAMSQVCKCRRSKPPQPISRLKKKTAKGGKKNGAPLPCDPFRLMPRARTAVCVCVCVCVFPFVLLSLRFGRSSK